MQWSAANLIYQWSRNVLGIGGGAGQGECTIIKTRYTYDGSLYSILSTTFIINLDSDSAWVQVPLWDLVLPKCSCKVMHIYNTKLFLWNILGGARPPPIQTLGGPVAPPAPPPPPPPPLSYSYVYQQVFMERNCTDV